MGFGTEILFVLALGMLVVRPKHLHVILRNVARVKAQFEAVARGLESQLREEMNAGKDVRQPDGSRQLAESAKGQLPPKETAEDENTRAA
jgi:Sec-independent protein translocase protein TatA